MAEFSAQSKKLVELFNSIREEPKKFWNVPDYQRDFTWKEEQFKEFWEDLHAEHESAFFGDLLFIIKFLISSPVKVSYNSKALANLCKSSIFSVSIFFALL